jgi:hypothetical protein
MFLVLLQQRHAIINHARSVGSAPTCCRRNTPSEQLRFDQSADLSMLAHRAQAARASISQSLQLAIDTDFDCSIVSFEDEPPAKRHRSRPRLTPSASSSPSSSLSCSTPPRLVVVIASRSGRWTTFPSTVAGTRLQAWISARHLEHPERAFLMDGPLGMGGGRPLVVGIAVVVGHFLDKQSLEALSAPLADVFAVERESRDVRVRVGELQHAFLATGLLQTPIPLQGHPSHACSPWRLKGLLLESWQDLPLSGAAQWRVRDAIAAWTATLKVNLRAVGVWIGSPVIASMLLRREVPAEVVSCVLHDARRFRLVHNEPSAQAETAYMESIFGEASPELVERRPRVDEPPRPHLQHRTRKLNVRGFVRA